MGEGTLTRLSLQKGPRCPLPQAGEGANAACRMAMPDLIRTFIERGDLAHLALVLWAGSTTALLYLTLRALFATSRRFDDFVRELARFNEKHVTRTGGRR